MAGEQFDYILEELGTKKKLCVETPQTRNFHLGKPLLDTIVLTVKVMEFD